MTPEPITAPVKTVEEIESSLNLVAFALGIGTLVFALNTSLILLPFVYATAATGIALSVAGLATRRAHRWGAWTGGILSALALGATQMMLNG